MTQDEIILAADASGLSYYGMGKDRDRFLHHVETFADLVALAEREECVRMCNEADKSTHPADLANAIRAKGNT